MKKYHYKDDVSINSLVVGQPNKNHCLMVDFSVLSSTQKHTFHVSGNAVHSGPPRGGFLIIWPKFPRNEVRAHVIACKVTTRFMGSETSLCDRRLHREVSAFKGSHVEVGVHCVWGRHRLPPTKATIQGSAREGSSRGS